MDTAGDSPVPIVDYGSFLHGLDDDKRRVAAQIDEAFRAVGFVCLVNHGIEKAKVDECFEWVSVSDVFSYGLVVSSSPRRTFQCLFHSQAFLGFRQTIVDHSLSLAIR